jgi:hypothetical protein
MRCGDVFAITWIRKRQPAQVRYTVYSGSHNEMQQALALNLALITAQQLDTKRLTTRLERRRRVDNGKYLEKDCFGLWWRHVVDLHRVQAERFFDFSSSSGQSTSLEIGLGSHFHQHGLATTMNGTSEANVFLGRGKLGHHGRVGIVTMDHLK